MTEVIDNNADKLPAVALLPDTALCKSSDLKALLAEMRPKGNAQVYGLLPSISKWKRYIAQDP